MKTDLNEELEQKLKEGKGFVIRFKGSGEKWTPEKKAELRKKMPEKLNKLGEWFFSTDEPMIIVNDHEAIYGK